MSPPWRYHFAKAIEKVREKEMADKKSLLKTWVFSHGW